MITKNGHNRRSSMNEFEARIKDEQQILLDLQTERRNLEHTLAVQKFKENHCATKIQRVFKAFLLYQRFRAKK